MNWEEIDEMMSHLPSQQPEESLTQRVFIGTIFIAFLVLACMMPDLIAN